MTPFESITRFHALPPAGGVGGLYGSSMALYLALAEGGVLAVEDTEEEAQRLLRDIEFYRKALGRDADNVRYLPEGGSPEADGQRARAVMDLFMGESPMLFVSTADALDQEVLSPERVVDSALSISNGDEVSREALESRLAGLGYTRVSLVTAEAQYSMRGFILDIYPVTAPGPYRIEFFGDEIENIRAFEIETQRSRADADNLLVLPALAPEGGEPAWELFQSARVCAAASVAPERIKTPEHITLARFTVEGSPDRALPVEGHGIAKGERKDIYALPGAIKAMSGGASVLVVASSRGQADRLRDVFRESDLPCPFIDLKPADGPSGLMRIVDYEGSPFMTVGRLSEGVHIPGLMVITERELFGGRPSAYRSMKKSRVANLLTNIEDLAQGDLVVHEDRGIGRFHALEHTEVEGEGYDMLLIEYAEGARLHIPVSAIDRIRKYHADEASTPKLDSLSSKRWQTTKARVRKRIMELAGRLISLYAERELSDAMRMSSFSNMHREFESFFPYVETPDQLRAIKEIKDDLSASKPMDRLLCGDVGYGKTEVAMRAAFTAVSESAQVAVLVPTTLLCEQHTRVFRQRFSAFPVRVESLSRFRSKKETDATLARIKSGDADIVIATHGLLRQGIEFLNLGLLIIDEEHRFGVRQKERLKELKKGVHVLAMSATPIPRTLQMSLSGIRSMSVIETPPEERMAVRTTVAHFGREIIREAIMRELHRDGQVFFVHNRIKDIERTHELLKGLVPEARIAVAHGQSTEKQLEGVMLEFLDGKIDVLLSTAIVGSGLDIPTANTIIVDIADRMGLADLYQLKGRVGRGDRRGYAYFLIPGEDVITEDARRRLEALQEMSYMGAGFRLAMRDMEIRGAGNMLGPEQSGAIDDVGFDLYMEMLEAAVSEIRGQKRAPKVRTTVNLRTNAYVPEGYIDDMALRLSVYRQVASAPDRQRLASIREEMKDRFGSPPEPFEHLLHIRGLALIAAECMITDISLRGRYLRFTLHAEAEFPAEKLMPVLGKGIRFRPEGFEVELKANALAAAECERVLEKLTPVLRTDGISA